MEGSEDRSADGSDPFASDLIAEEYRELIDIGPRFTGTAAERQARDFVLERLQVLGLETTEWGYTYPGWQLRSKPRFEVTAPEQRSLDALAFVYCAGTDGREISGTLERIGVHTVIGCFDWVKFAVVGDDGAVLALASVRTDGPPNPQPLDEHSVVLPHFILGEQDLAVLENWIDKGERVVVRGTIDASHDSSATSANIIAKYRPRRESAFRIVLCGHLDSMYDCPGANDNGGGSIALIALARAVAQARPPFGIDLIWFTGEECNLAGSTAYVAALSDSDLAEIRLLINLDGIAETTETLHVWSSAEDLEGAFRVLIGKHVAAVDGWDPAVVYTFPAKPGSDHVPFSRRGVRVSMFTGFEMCRYHLPSDVYRPELARNVEAVSRLVWDFLGAIDPDAADPSIFRGIEAQPIVGR